MVGFAYPTRLQTTMENFFALIIVFSIVFLIVGMISPKTVIRWGIDQKKTRGEVIKVYGFTLIAAFIAFGVTTDIKKGEVTVPTTSQDARTQSEQQPAAMPAVTPPPPPASIQTMVAAEVEFCNIIRETSKQYESLADQGANELKLSKMRTIRKSSLRMALRSGKVKNWTGTLKALSTTSEGKAHVAVELPCETVVSVQTWNNELSDMSDKTLIPQSSPIFDKVAELKVGQKVIFDGQFLPDDKNGFVEQSISEAGSLKEPEFSFRFSNIELAQ